MSGQQLGEIQRTLGTLLARTESLDERVRERHQLAVIAEAEAIKSDQAIRTEIAQVRADIRTISADVSQTKSTIEEQTGAINAIDIRIGVIERVVGAPDVGLVSRVAELHSPGTRLRNVVAGVGSVAVSVGLVMWTIWQPVYDAVVKVWVEMRLK